MDVGDWCQREPLELLTAFSTESKSWDMLISMVGECVQPNGAGVPCVWQMRDEFPTGAISSTRTRAGFINWSSSTVSGIT